MSRFEHWVWTELLAFDVNKEDGGAAEYLETLGFVPEGLCLLLTSPDFIMSHRDMSAEWNFPEDFCSRNGHPGNEARDRQVWTNWRLRSLISALTKRGCPVYISVFNGYLLNKFHHEWVSDHNEVRAVFSFYDGDPLGRGTDISLVKKLADGTPVADLFVPRLVQCCRDYGFAGFHGADGCGPWWASATETDMSDSFLADFLQPDWELPDFMRPPWDGKMTTLQQRSRWVWWNRRAEWISFLTETWCKLWQKITNGLHAAGLKAVINSANTRASFDALYETGINYRRMAELGIDAMVVETVALGIELTHPGESPHHDDFPAALQEIRAMAPDFKLIFLHGIKDVVENWDNLRQAPGAYIRELCRLLHSYYWNGKSLEPAAKGLLGCLADGIDRSEWDFIRSNWQKLSAFEATEAGEAVVLYSPEQYEAGVADYSRDGFPSGHDMVRELMENGFDIDTSASLKDADSVSGLCLLPSAHIYPLETLQKLASRPGLTALCGRADALQSLIPQGHAVTDGRMTLVIPGFSSGVQTVPADNTPWLDDELTVKFSAFRKRMAIRPEFWKQATALLQNAALEVDRMLGRPHLQVVNAPECTLRTIRLADGSLLAILENRATWRRYTVAVKADRAPVKIKSVMRFPVRPIPGDDELTYCFPLPPRGIAMAQFWF